MNGSPADPTGSTRRSPAAGSGRSCNAPTTAGAPGSPVGNEFAYDGVPGTHQWYDGTQHPWEFKRVWHLEPSLTDPDTVYAGVEDAALFRSTDGGQNWQELPARGPRDRRAVAARRRRVPAHDPDRPENPRADGHRHLGGRGVPHRRRRRDLAPINRGLRSAELPDEDAEVGHCVHRIAMHPSQPDVLFMQKHWDVMRSDDAGESWQEVSGNLPTDFGFPIDVHAHEPETIYVVPIKSDSEHIPPTASCASTAAGPAATSGRPLTKGLPQKPLLRERAARRDGGRHARSVRHLLRHDRRAGLRVAGRRRQLERDRPGSPAGPVGGGPDAAVIRVVLSTPPADPRRQRRRGAARPARPADPAQRPRRARGELSGPARDDPRSRHGEAARLHPLLRLRARPLAGACDEPLPGEVASGAEPFRVVGAMAGGGAGRRPRRPLSAVVAARGGARRAGGALLPGGRRGRSSAPPASRRSSACCSRRAAFDPRLVVEAPAATLAAAPFGDARYDHGAANGAGS